MARYVARTCPKCKDYLGVVIPEPPDPVDEIPIKAACLRCGYKLPFSKIFIKKRLVSRKSIDTSSTTREPSCGTS